MKGSDKSSFFAAERQEPYTAAEHAEATGHQEEYARDVPRTCPGTWQWNPAERRYELLGHQEPGCPWHTPERTE
jgi:hypothetical protein